MYNSVKNLRPRLPLAVSALACMILVWGMVTDAQPPAGELSGNATASSDNTPQTTLVAFYHWYLKAFAEERNPVRDDRAQMEAYVSKVLLQKIERRIESPEGLDEDYFTETQDFLDDWANNIVVSDVRIDGKAASAIVTLGATKQSRHHLKLNLVNERGVWKISKVRRPRPSLLGNATR